MEIGIKWQQRYAESGTTRHSLIKRVWNTFDIADILERSRNHAINLFTRDIPVIIKQGSAIISNDREMRNLYRKKEYTVYDLAAIQPSEEPLKDVGFIK